MIITASALALLGSLVFDVFGYLEEDTSKVPTRLLAGCALYEIPNPYLNTCVRIFPGFISFGRCRYPKSVDGIDHQLLSMFEEDDDDDDEVINMHSCGRDCFESDECKAFSLGPDDVGQAECILYKGPHYTHGHLIPKTGEGLWTQCYDKPESAEVVESFTDEFDKDSVVETAYSTLDAREENTTDAGGTSEDIPSSQASVLDIYAMLPSNQLCPDAGLYTIDSEQECELVANSVQSLTWRRSYKGATSWATPACHTRKSRVDVFFNTNTDVAHGKARSDTSAICRTTPYMYVLLAPGTTCPEEGLLPIENQEECKTVATQVWNLQWTQKLKTSGQSATSNCFTRLNDPRRRVYFADVEDSLGNVAIPNTIRVICRSSLKTRIEPELKCPRMVDASSGFFWSETKAGEIASIPCAKGYFGFKARRCDQGRWDEETHDCKPCQNEDEWWKDRGGWYCADWSGDDCWRAVEDWSTSTYTYTQEDENEILDKCQGSCQSCGAFSREDHFV